MKERITAEEIRAVPNICRLCGIHVSDTPGGLLVRRVNSRIIFWCMYSQIVSCLERAGLSDLAREMRNRGF